MKKDRMYELMTELRDRQFTVNECYELFNAIDWYLSNRQEYINSVGEVRELREEEFESAKAELERTLSALGLDYTVDEFNTED